MGKQARKPDDPATIGDVLVAVDTLGRAVDRRLADVERSQAALRGDVAELQTKVDRLESGQARVETKVDRIESLLVKLLEGQAVLHQNDMELKRRLDAAS